MVLLYVMGGISFDVCIRSVDEETIDDADRLLPLYAWTKWNINTTISIPISTSLEQLL